MKMYQLLIWFSSISIRLIFYNSKQNYPKEYSLFTGTDLIKADQYLYQVSAIPPHLHLIIEK